MIWKQSGLRNREAYLDKREKRHAIYKNQVLNLHAHYFQSVHDQLGLPFLQDGSVQDEM